MSEHLEKLAEQPLWKLALGWAGASVLLCAGWYTLYYSDAVDAQAQEKNTLAAVKQEREELEGKLAGFEEEMEKAAQSQKEIDAVLEELPMSTASVDHMMRTFQQQGRLVGLNFNQWSPRPETKEQYYAKTSVAVTASGSWNQLAEFFRRVSELKKIVSIHDLNLSSARSGKGNSGEQSNALQIRFTATAYRFLTDEERKASRTKGKSRKRRRRG